MLTLGRVQKFSSNKANGPISGSGTDTQTIKLWNEWYNSGYSIKNSNRADFTFSLSSSHKFQEIPQWGQNYQTQALTISLSEQFCAIRLSACEGRPAYHWNVESRVEWLVVVKCGCLTRHSLSSHASVCCRSVSNPTPKPTCGRPDNIILDKNFILHQESPTYNLRTIIR